MGQKIVYIGPRTADLTPNDTYTVSLNNKINDNVFLEGVKGIVPGTLIKEES